MYTVAVSQDFIARHFLIGGDWGPENKKHSHNYRVEVQLKGKTLDKHGYLVDISDIKDNLKSLISYYCDSTLNELPEFKGINPSIEHFACIFHRMLSNKISGSNISVIKIKIWEDITAWASYDGER